MAPQKANSAYFHRGDAKASHSFINARSTALVMEPHNYNALLIASETFMKDPFHACISILTSYVPKVEDNRRHPAPLIFLQHNVLNPTAHSYYRGGELSITHPGTDQSFTESGRLGIPQRVNI
jgi:hypothetical protein